MHSAKDSDAVALFCTNEYPSLSLSPVGLIRGDLGESPVCIEFAGHFDEGALLTIVRIECCRTLNLGNAS